MTMIVDKMDDYDFDLMLCVSEYIDRIREKAGPDKEINFVNLYHRISVLVREVIQKHATYGGLNGENSDSD